MAKKNSNYWDCILPKEGENSDNPQNEEENPLDFSSATPNQEHEQHVREIFFSEEGNDESAVSSCDSSTEKCLNSDSNSDATSDTEMKCDSQEASVFEGFQTVNRSAKTNDSDENSDKITSEASFADDVFSGWETPKKKYTHLNFEGEESASDKTQEDSAEAASDENQAGMKSENTCRCACEKGMDAFSAASVKFEEVEDENDDEEVVYVNASAPVSSEPFGGVSAEAVSAVASDVSETSEEVQKSEISGSILSEDGTLRRVLNKYERPVSGFGFGILDEMTADAVVPEAAEPETEECAACAVPVQADSAAETSEISENESAVEPPSNLDAWGKLAFELGLPVTAAEVPAKEDAQPEEKTGKNQKAGKAGSRVIMLDDDETSEEISVRSNSGKAEKAGKMSKSGKDEKDGNVRNERAPREERDEKRERRERPARSGRGERLEREERPARGERLEREERPARGERPARKDSFKRGAAALEDVRETAESVSFAADDEFSVPEERSAMPEKAERGGRRPRRERTHRETRDEDVMLSEDVSFGASEVPSAESSSRRRSAGRRRAEDTAEGKDKSAILGGIMAGVVAEKMAEAPENKTSEEAGSFGKFGRKSAKRGRGAAAEEEAPALRSRRERNLRGRDSAPASMFDDSDFDVPEEDEYIPQAQVMNEAEEDEEEQEIPNGARSRRRRRSQREKFERTRGSVPAAEMTVLSADSDEDEDDAEEESRPSAGSAKKRTRRHSRQRFDEDFEEENARWSDDVREMEVTADADEDEDDEDEEEAPRGRRPRRSRRSNAEREDRFGNRRRGSRPVDDEDEDDEPLDEEMHVFTEVEDEEPDEDDEWETDFSKHEVPGWRDTIDIIVNSNLKARNREPSSMARNMNRGMKRGGKRK